MATVSDMVAQRRSCRAFSDRVVDVSVVREILVKALRAPSGGNLQPWHFYLLHGDVVPDFCSKMQHAAQAAPMGEAGAYEIYPKGLAEPYRSRRFQVGEDMYSALGIAREDKFKRLMWLANNFRFFGAPVGLMCFVDKSMGPPQWSDLGMVLQTIMLLLEEAGLNSCAQESWSLVHRSVHTYLRAPDNQMLFCGMAIGYADTGADVNKFTAQRAPLTDVLVELSAPPSA